MNIPVKGLKELDDYLSVLPKNMQKGAYRAALVAAAKPIRDEARAKAPKGKTGKLARAIRTGSARQNQDGTFSVSISLSGNDHGFIGLFHEYGVKPHMIASTVKGAGRVAIRKAQQAGDSSITKPMKIGEDFVSGIIRHPGHIGRPFMRPALDMKADEAIKAFAARIREYIEGKTGFAAPLDEAA